MPQNSCHSAAIAASFGSWSVAELNTPCHLVSMERNAAETDDTVEIRLGLKEAVVLFELISRWCDPKTPHTPDRLCFESRAECAALSGLLADLEKQLVAPLKPEYSQILADARSTLAERWDYPTLNG